VHKNTIFETAGVPGTFAAKLPVVKRLNSCQISQEKHPNSQNWFYFGNFLAKRIVITKNILNLVKSSIPNFICSWEFEFTKVFPHNNQDGSFFHQENTRLRGKIHKITKLGECW